MVWPRPRITRVAASPRKIEPAYALYLWRVPMTASAPAAYQLFVGADIAARSFTAAWGRPDAPLPRPARFEQTPSGYTSFQAALAATGVPAEQTLIVMEAT